MSWNRGGPEVLVLGGGGLLGEAWMMGLLSGLEAATALDAHGFDYYIGTSAGAIVAAHLACGYPPRRPAISATQLAAFEPNGNGSANGAAGRGLDRRSREKRLSSAISAAFVAGLATPGGALVRAALLRGLGGPQGTLDHLHAHIAQMNLQFDGKLRVVAVDRRTGRRVVFGTPGAPPAAVADAVTASCTVPWRFRPVAIGGREYVDGAVWSPTNLDAAPAGAGVHILCLNPTANLHGARGPVDLIRRVSRSAARVETVGVQRRGATVQMVSPDAASAAAMGVSLMDRRRTEAVLEAGYQQGLAAEPDWFAAGTPRP
jgi:NTE family protein